MLFKCKICGGSLNIRQGERVTECEYCGVKQTVSVFIDPNKQEIYNRANSYLMNNEYDKAENLYNQILFGNKEDAEAYWNVLMCRYGVTYVKDPATGKYIPTCNRTLYTSILNDENYKKALEYADDKQKALYLEEAQIIDNIQKGVLKISRKEKPFDIFISYKEADADGVRTNDSIVAQELYDKLTAEGYKVFFSRITLESKIGSEYEPYIYAALASSKVMITVSSTKENIEAVWVKNEWSRYLALATKDSNKTIIPLYYNMDRSDLPDEFANLSAHDMKSNGFEQELIRGIKKLIPIPVKLQERRKKRNKILKITGVLAAFGIVIGVICTVPWLKKLPEYKSAMQLYYDKNYPEATWAFEKMGNYRNSEEMKEKCEGSWRRSLSSIASYNTMTRSNGSYYVTSNGTVGNFSFDPGIAAEDIDINEHGKIVSLDSNYGLVALYEDGYIYNRPEINGLNVVQVSQFFNSTFATLRDDGTVVYEDDEYHVDAWLEPTKQWKNIVEIGSCLNRLGYGALNDACLIGRDVDGKLHMVVYDRENSLIKGKENLVRFRDVKCFDVFISSHFSNVKYLNIVAITNHNTVISSMYGIFKEEPIDDNIVDVKLENEYSGADSSLEIYFLRNDGKLHKKDEEIYVLDDVVYVSGDFFVTRSGNIYCNYLNPKKTEGKTKVHNEWIERMN